jgi:hypothetical protein
VAVGRSHHHNVPVPAGIFPGLKTQNPNLIKNPQKLKQGTPSFSHNKKRLEDGENTQTPHQKKGG